MPDATEQAVIVRVRALRASGMTLRAIVAALGATGVPTRSRRPSRTSAPSTVIANAKAAA